jgi:hypothetical protein
MERFNFSKGHIFIKSDNNKTFWTMIINGSGNCGVSENKVQAIQDILNIWKLSITLKTEIKNLFDNKNKIISSSPGKQLNLF